MTKTSRKILSFLLASLIVFSVFVPALTAFVASAVSEVEEVENKLTAFESFGNTADPTEEQLASYNDVISAYAALNAAQKEQVNILLFDKIFRAIVDYERAVYKKNNPSAAAKAQYVYGYEQAMLLLTPPAYVKNGENLGIILNDNNKTPAEKFDALVAADENTRLYAGGWYNSYAAFYYAVDYNPVKALELVVTAYATAKTKETPNPDPKPARLTKPQGKNYPLGEDDPGYIADFAAWLAAEEAYYVWYANDQIYRVNFEDELIEMAAAQIAEYVPFWQVTKQLRTAKSNFDKKVPGAKEEAAQALAAYEALSDFNKLKIQKYSKNVYYVAVDKGNSWTYDYKRPTGLVTACEDIVNAQFLDDFVALIESIQAPYTREDINAAKEARGKVPASLVGAIPPEIAVKYADILASIGPDVPSYEQPDLTGKPFTKVKYPFGMSKRSTVKTYKALEALLVNGLGLDVKALLNEELYTNKMVGTIASAIYPLLGEQSSLIAQGPYDLSTKLDEEKFAGAKAALEAAVSEYNDKGTPIKNLADWNNVVFENGDWGFQDGDREGFLDAAAASFRALSLLTLAIKFENNISTTNGTYTYHAYEDLVVLFESLGLRGVISSHDYTLAVNAEPNSFKKMDKRIRPILVPVMNLLDDMSDDLMGTLLTVLPRLAVTLNNGVLDGQIRKILSEMSMVSIDPPDLTSAGFFNLIAPMLSSIEVEPGVTLDLTLNQDKFLAFLKDLEGCGKYTVKDSISRTNAYIATIDADKADTFVVLFYYLHGELTTPENVEALNRLVESMDLGGSEFLVRLLLNMVLSLPAPTTLNLLRYILPFANVIIGISKIF
ncbi:MAG TPA: hypothetical protein PKW24_00585 [Clostridiales bacterium]|nr:hypothetical protein [Clostridiales bacterium]